MFGKNNDLLSTREEAVRLDADAKRQAETFAKFKNDLPSPIEIAKTIGASLNDVDARLDEVAAVVAQRPKIETREVHTRQEAWINDVTTSDGMERQLTISSVGPLPISAEQRKKMIDLAEALFEGVREMLPAGATLSYSIFSLEK